MATKTEKQQQAEQHDQDARHLQATIGKQVMQSLGQPNNLQKLEVRHLWKDNYRVNIFVGQDAASLRVAHSYFLLTDGSGKVVASNPKITRQYTANQS